MTPEGEFRAGLDGCLHRAIADALPEKWRDDWLSFGDPRPIIETLFAFRLPDQPEGPRVAVVGEQVGLQLRSGDLTSDTRPRNGAMPVFTLFPATPETP